MTVICRKLILYYQSVNQTALLIPFAQIAHFDHDGYPRQQQHDSMMGPK